jgi:hypothetical protein
VPASHASQVQRSRLVPVRASEEQAASAFDYEEPETAKEGIDLGLVLCKQGRWEEGQADMQPGERAWQPSARASLSKGSTERQQCSQHPCCDAVCF